MIESSALAKMVAELLMVVQAFTSYELPETSPRVEFLPQAELQERACGAPCQVFGFFPPGDVILLDERLDPLGNEAARGILLHELVHYMQQENGAFPGETGCQRWRSRELEAFDVQIRWLSERNAPLYALGRNSRLPMHACRDEGSGPPGIRPLG